MREIATLYQQEAPLRMRSDRSVPEFPRLYKAASLDISLHLASSGRGGSVLIGILTGAGESADAFEGMAAELYTAPGPYARDGDEQAAIPLLRTQIDDLGHLVFRGVPPGDYLLVLHLPGLEVIIEDLPIRQW